MVRLCSNRCDVRACYARTVAAGRPYRASPFVHGGL